MRGTTSAQYRSLSSWPTVFSVIFKYKHIRRDSSKLLDDSPVIYGSPRKTKFPNYTLAQTPIDHRYALTKRENMKLLSWCYLVLAALFRLHLHWSRESGVVRV